MSDLRQTLTDVLSGKLPPEEFLEAIDEYLSKPNANIQALRSVIDAAEHLGLANAVAKQARDKIAAAGADRTQMIGDPTEVLDTGPEGDRTVLTTGQQPTRLRVDPASADDDKTVQMDDDATVKVSDDDATIQVGGEDATVQVSDDDPFAMTALPDPPKGGEDKGPGSVLKGRFRLEQVIGQGGMGAVYKAVDLLKVEARDRNPYIAVKLLIGDFKEHPEAFIALQRESAKAQRLAHPNIATVYDFDRDGETVYMTMELMVGAELAKYIKKLPVGGLPVTEANRIVEQLCAGLQYAHARGLVHSDFKPGNAFVLDDGTVKLLDFGIARASKTKGDAEGESTVFDPGQLGALTPAYATIEMFEGLDPDPRDDLYALACVAYELYTGKHPFNKMSAVKAKEKGLKVAPVPKLTKRQNRTLIKGLALMRDDRIASVEEFWEGLRPRKDYTWQIVGGATVGVILIGLLTYGPIVNFFQEREHTAIVLEIDSGDEARLAAALERIDQLPAERQRVVVERAQERVVGYFEARAEDAIDESQGHYDFPAALAEIDMLGRYMPDSARVAAIRLSITQRREQLVSNLNTDFARLFEEQRILPDPDAQDITEVVAVLRQVLPDSPLLNDARLSGAYANLASAAVRASDWERANEILQVGLAYAPTDAGLIDLRDTVGTELRRQQEAAMVASLSTTLRSAAPRTLADFRGVREELRRLSELRPDNELVRGFDAPLRRGVEAELAAATGASDWARADAVLADFASVLPLDFLVRARTDLTRQQVAAGFDARSDAARVADIASRITQIRELIANPTFDDDFSRALTTGFKDLTARLTADTAGWDTLRTEIAMAHIEHARGLINDSRFGVAGATLDQGASFHPALPEFATARDTLAAAETAFRAEQVRREQLAAIDATKERILTAASARNVNEAVRDFNALKNQLPADDVFITTTGPQAIAQAYTDLATQAGENNRFQNAVDFARAGLQVLPNSQDLQVLLARYQNLALRAEVTGLIGNLRGNGFPAFQRRYNEVRQALPGAEAAAFEREVVTALIARMTALDRGNELSAANELKTLALQLFPGNQQVTQTNLRQPERPSQFAPRVAAAIGDNQLTEARRLLAEAQRTEPNHTELANFPGQLTERERQGTDLFTRARQQHAANDINGARATIDRALAIWSDNPEFLSFKNERLPADRERVARADGSFMCSRGLAGLGTSGRATCFDYAAGVRGPTMVVVPAPSGGQPFVIGKFEVAVGEYNNYCSATGSCQPQGGDLALPVTGITIQAADAYVVWLTANSPGTYRIPTDAEWAHAAGGGGNPGSSGDNNCRVVQAGSIIKGHSVLRVNTGSDNGWGLRNHVGNAQEWVRAGGSLMARGGGFEDPLSTCEVGLSRPHGGSGDAMTGFRVARDVD